MRSIFFLTTLIIPALLCGQMKRLLREQAELCVLQTWVNGKQVKDGPGYVMKPHDKIIVGFGKPGSFPTKDNFQFPAGE